MYRAINNPIARRKWLTFCLTLFLVGIGCFIYKLSHTHNVIITLLSLSIFVLMAFLYTIITLGKPRFYYMNDEIVYRPFKTPLSNVEDFEVDYGKKIIKLKLKKSSPLAVRTLYFESEDDLEEALRFLKRRIKA